MAFRDFSFPEVQQLLDLTVAEADLTSGAAPLKPRDEFAAMIRDGAELALAINSEKARSEFIIAPVLLELKRTLNGSFGLFSGVELNVDASRGLNGFCDFILTKSPKQIILTAPLVAIVEAKNDNVHYGFGQCIAQMVATREFNQKANQPAGTVYGVVTTGTAWKFMHLKKSEVTFDIHEYYVVDLGKIMGILTQMIRGAS